MKPLPYPGYFITQEGNVYSSKTKKFLKLSVNRTGYVVVRVSLSKKEKISIRIHREVAIAFIPNPKNKKEVNHKDGNKQNNCVSNLEWVTRKENMAHAFESGCFKERTDNQRKATLEQQQMAVDLYLSGTSVKNISQQLEVSPITVYVWFNRLIPIEKRKQQTSLNISRGKING